MTQSSFPFDGSDVTEAQWRKMARLWLGTGVVAGELDELAVFADGSGMQVKIRTGVAWTQGHYYESDAVVTLAIEASDPIDDRIDRVVLRADFVANLVSLVVLEGAAAGVPVAPALTQNDSVHELALATVAVGNGVLSILVGNITDERTFAAPLAHSH